MLVDPPPDERALWSQRLLCCAQEWRTESTRLWSVSAGLPVSGTCGEAIVAAAESLVREMRAVAAEVDRLAGALRVGLPT
jgi:trehalose utilization protein